MDKARLNEDDLKAQRVASLAARFMGGKGAVTSQEIHSTFYQEASDATFNRSFSRDREDLAICGLVIKKCGMGDGGALWCVDEECSFAGQTTLSAQEAAAFAVACSPFLDDESFPMSDELGFALAKIYRYFDTSARNVPGGGRGSQVEQALRLSMEAGRALQIDYEKADGEKSRRLLAPYGTFSLRGHLYVVAPRIEQDGSVVPDSVRTYRLDRIEDAKTQAVEFRVPADFDVADYRKLPFQMGKAVCQGRFSVPEKAQAEVERACGEGLVNGELVADVASLTDAAAWAISVGVRPVQPKELVDTWKAQLEGVMQCG